MQRNIESIVTIGAVAVLLVCTCTATWIAAQYRDEAQQLRAQIRAGTCTPAAVLVKRGKRTKA